MKGSYTSTVPPIPLSADALSQKSENLLAEESKKVVLDADVGYARLGDCSQLSNNSTSQNITEEDKEKGTLFPHERL